MIPIEIPLFDQPGPDSGLRVVQFRDTATVVPRRGFLAVIGTAAMTLGLTVATP